MSVIKLVYKGNIVRNIELPEGTTKLTQEFIRDIKGVSHTNLLFAHIPEGITEIGTACFRSAGRLRGMVFPRSLTRVGDAAFVHCISLRFFMFQGSEVRLGKGALYTKALNRHTGQPCPAKYIFAPKDLTIDRAETAVSRSTKILSYDISKLPTKVGDLEVTKSFYKHIFEKNEIGTDLDSRCVRTQISQIVLGKFFKEQPVIRIISSDVIKKNRHGLRASNKKRSSPDTVVDVSILSPDAPREAKRATVEALVR